MRTCSNVASKERVRETLDCPLALGPQLHTGDVSATPEHINIDILYMSLMGLLLAQTRLMQPQACDAGPGDARVSCITEPEID